MLRPRVSTILLAREKQALKVRLGDTLVIGLQGVDNKERMIGP